MLTRILQLLSLSCKHNRTTKPFAAAAGGTSAAASAQWDSVGSGPSHYIVCLDCGKKFAYDWSNMRVIR